MRTSEDELCDLLRDGAERLCDYAIGKWASNAYRMEETVRQQFLTEWHTKRREIRPLMKRIRAALKTGNI